MLHLKLLDKQEQAKPKARSRETIKLRAKINKKKTNKNNKKLPKEKICCLKRYITFISP
jgi:hypothetical protein